ncbi:MAG: 4-hydroxythreonine-4-phosphate dehydrogenase PdxA [Gammaproteobacteria bacterium]|jgi:4-hydroxythreonine-4-phosphate dehydrogenase
MTYKPRLLITSGEPAGIGPDLIVKLSQLSHNYDITVIADPDLIEQRAELLSLCINVNTISANYSEANQYDTTAINILPVKLKQRSIPGKLDVNNADYVLKTLKLATEQCLSKNYDAVITAPIQKSIINDAGINFSGHTEFFAEQCNNAYPVMMLACPDLKVALVTTHLALRDIPNAITKERVEKTISIVIDGMINQFGIEKPSIVVCGLNPHAGEEGHLGMEEINIINPVINDFVRDGYDVTGALPADTAFRLEQRQKTDAFICMYHDQGLPVLKTLGFGEAVNITLGLPIIRTSVDHGTALELAGTGKAQCDSLLAAIEMADTMARYKSNKQLETESI